jgi:hypothetical protein
VTYALGGDKRKNRHPLIASDDMGGSAKRETLELVRAYYKIGRAIRSYVRSAVQTLALPK